MTKRKLNERIDYRLQLIFCRCQEFLRVKFYRLDRDLHYFLGEDKDKNHCNDIYQPKR